MVIPSTLIANFLFSRPNCTFPFPVISATIVRRGNTTGSNIKTFNAKVINASTGNVVFEWNSINEGWDGNDASGRKLDVGRYFLSIDAVGHDGEVLTKKLGINLLDE